MPPAFSATINTTYPSGEALTYAELKNTGQDALKRVKIADSDGRVLGIISQLEPEKSQTIIVSGEVENASATAIDSSGSLVKGSIQYIRSNQAAPVPELLHGMNRVSTLISSGEQAEGSASDELRLQTLSSAREPDIPDLFQAADNKSQQHILEPQRSPKFNLTIETNRSEGYRGDAIYFRCTAENVAKEDLSSVELSCGGKKRSTTYLIPGDRIHVDGSFILQDIAELNATVKGRDAKGDNWTTEASARVWMISPQLRLEASLSPEVVHRGDQITLTVSARNAGEVRLSNISISDSFGQIDNISFLDPGQNATVHKNWTAEVSLLDQVRAEACDIGGREVYGSANTSLRVLRSGLSLSVMPQEALVYPGQPTQAIWVLNNTGEEILKDISLAGEGSVRYRLNELGPGASISIAATYVQNKTARINITATGYDSQGYAAVDSESTLIRTISPGISLKVAPANIEARAGEEFNVTCLVTNTGDDVLTSVTLRQMNEVLAARERLDPGDFEVFSARLKMASNATLHFTAEGTDSMGRTWSDSAQARATLVTSAIKISAKAFPEMVKFGEESQITCIVANPGSAPLYNIFVISRVFGPLGVIEYLAPGHQKIISAKEPVTADVKDDIRAEGSTSEKQAVTDSCALHIGVVSLPSSAKGSLISYQPKMPASSHAGNGSRKDGPLLASSFRSKISLSPATGDSNSTRTNESNAFRSNGSKLSGGLPKETAIASGSAKIAHRDTSGSARKTGSPIIDEISGLLLYIKMILERMDHNKQAVSRQNVSSPVEITVPKRASKNYELAIESAKGSDFGDIKILDVSAHPPLPPAGEPVKITVHVQSQRGIKSASVKWGLANSPLTRQEMLSVNRMLSIPMALESGDSKDGYWSCTIPGRAPGSYMVLSVALSDGASLVDDGPYMIHWSTVTSSQKAAPSPARTSQATAEGMLYIESSVVRGTGEVSIKDAFDDSAISFSERMKGNGSIRLESLRCLDKNSPMVNFSERRDLVFEGGQLKGVKSMESPSFHGGMGASITERFNLSHVDKTEMGMIRSLNSSDNTLALDTEQAFNGTWNIKTQYSQFFKKIKGDQQYKGSFQTQKSIKFQDAGKK